MLMKKSEIIIGGIYTNGKSERKVIDIDSTGKYRLNIGQEDNNTLLYETVKGANKKNGYITLVAFSSWAKSRVY